MTLMILIRENSKILIL